MTAKTPVILCIMDGWGSSANSALNAVDRAHTPVIDELTANYPHCQLQASEDAVGLPKGQPGNSEVGHLTIGSGRLIMQDLPRISAACKIGEVDRLPPLIDMAKQCAQTGSALHLTGLTSSGGVHAHTDHIHRIAEIMATANIPVWLHIITDGRDTLPKAAADELPAFIARLPSTCGIASITGRYFAMDRDNRWDRTQAFLDVLCTGKAPHHATDIQTALADAYARGETDEFITATCINGYAGPAENDCLLVANFRVDRVRQFLRALVRPEETGCRLDNKPTRPFSAGMLSMTPVADDLTNTVKPLFMPPELRNGLGEIVSKAGFNQLRVAETEKYPHV
ncbi:MAG: 2,3-bisphosphoglycerate-independent phosphoglycerate mutase, partial [Pseudomonadota bacterium]|nr:2,3-bisphosphoglycerate-independent phosphoglycerate mutase [Pseudomonadota bacterium]